jgi:NAD(P)-dependent dehydrogenase (short-subunit alcohol dehydrogenase family)
MSERKVALVTGASRGIGRGCALALARRGFDVVACARTLREGTPVEHSSTIKRSDTSPLPGSLETTAKEIEALGGRALVAKLDLLVRADVENAVRAALDAFGRLDVVVNNAPPGTWTCSSTRRWRSTTSTSSATCWRRCT